MFGENGAVLDELEESALERELSDKTAEYGLLSCVTTLLIAALIWFVIANHSHWFQSSFISTLLLVTIGLAFLPCALAFATKASSEGYLPKRLGGEPVHQHVGPGMSVMVIAIVFAIVFVARIFESNIGNLRITDDVGLAVVSLIGLAFLSLIFVPHILRSAGIQSLFRTSSVGGLFKSRIWKIITFVPRIVARGASIFDSWMVHAVAPMAGATQLTTGRRYIVLVLQIGATTLLAWNLPSPVGLFAIAWAALIAISVARRWSWTELDREYALRNPNYDDSNLRVGVKEDLRDEALLALLVMIFLLPLGMRQLHYSFGEVFVVPDGIEANPIAWISFFGAELAKSIPFVDWVDIYGAENSTRIGQFECGAEVSCDPQGLSRAAISSHIVFGARAVVDLVFLAALLQAISVARRWSQHKAMFFNKEIDRLDPMLERSEFSKVVRRVSGVWVFKDGIEKLEHYNKIRLASIRLTHGQDTAMWQVATEIMERKGIPTSTPSEQLSELVAQKRLDQFAVLAALKEAKDSDDFDIDTIIYARKQLNGKAAYNQARMELVDALIAYEVTSEMEPNVRSETLRQQRTALRRILVGETRDSISGVRLLALLSLADQLERPEVYRTFKIAAEHDPAKNVRDAATHALGIFENDRSAAEHKEPETEDA